MMGIVDKFVKNRMQAMVRKLVKQKRLKFINDHQVIYADQEKVTKQLTFDQFATLTVSRFATIADDKAPQVLDAGIGITAQIIKDVLSEEYRKGVRKI